ncbi:MAG: hypothetical protein HC908_07380 [Calothrix sp. SM1_7_51]|nr:hypothetical protein [Calothrix sp. SM1_7_51]
MEIPDELATRINNVEHKIPQILELGLRELNASIGAGFNGISEVLEFLAQLPTPEEIIALRPSKALQAQIDDLLEKNRNVGLTPDEEVIWQQYEYLEHLIRMTKIKAFLKLKGN